MGRKSVEIFVVVNPKDCKVGLKTSQSIERLLPSISRQLINSKSLFSSILTLYMGEMSLPMSYNGGLGMKTALQEENGFSCTLLDYITFFFTLEMLCVLHGSVNGH